MHLNVRYQIWSILQNSPLLREMIEKKEVGIVGSTYDLATGKVTFYETDHLFDAHYDYKTVSHHIPQTEKV